MLLRAKLANIMLSGDEVHVPILLCDLQQFHQRRLKGRYLVSGCWLLFNQLTQIRSCACSAFYQQPSTAVIHPRINVSAYQKHTFSHNSVKVAELQEAAAGGRSLEAAGLVVGVISSSSVTQLLLLKPLWTFKVDQPIPIPLTCSAPVWTEGDLLASFFCSMIIVCDFFSLFF